MKRAAWNVSRRLKRKGTGRDFAHQFAETKLFGELNERTRLLGERSELKDPQRLNHVTYSPHRTTK